MLRFSSSRVNPIERKTLYGPFAAGLPNWPLVGVAGKLAAVTDFTLPTEGFESPWAMAQPVFEYDSARLPAPPESPATLADWALANPGRFTYPPPPDYLGVTLLKQVLYGIWCRRLPFCRACTRSRWPAAWAAGGLLPDKPFSRREADRRDQSRRLVPELARTRGLPVVLVTHDAEDATAAGVGILPPISPATPASLRQPSPFRPKLCNRWPHFRATILCQSHQNAGRAR